MPLSDSLDQLAVAAGEAEQNLDALCDRVLAAVLGERDPGDDVALLAVRPVAAPAERIHPPEKRRALDDPAKAHFLDQQR